MYFDFIQVVIIPVSTVVIVTPLVLSTVRMTYATYKVDHVSLVILDGLICIVIKVRP